MIEVISDTIQEYKGVRYSKCGVYFQNSHKSGERRLHRVIYEDSYGKIEDGHHIHHVDHNVANNHPSNLCMITGREHAKRHWDEKTDEEKAKFTDHIDKGVEAAKIWHGSEDGADWHKAHYESMKDKLHIKTELECSTCGKKYEGLKREGDIRFCSNNCKAHHRRLSGVDDEDRNCVICDKVFKTNKYGKRLKCRRGCK